MGHGTDDRVAERNQGQECQEGKLHADGGGLYLKVTDTGSKSWVYRFKRKGKARDMGLGNADVEKVGGITLAQARKLAGDARQKLLDGIDPLDERKAETIVERRPRTPRTPRRRARSRPSRRARKSSSGQRRAAGRTRGTASSGPTRWPASSTPIGDMPVATSIPAVFLPCSSSRCSSPGGAGRWARRRRCGRLVPRRQRACGPASRRCCRRRRP